MAAMSQNPKQRRSSNGQCDRKTRSRSAANFVDSLLHTAPMTKKIRLTTNYPARVDASSSPSSTNPDFPEQCTTENADSFMTSPMGLDQDFGEDNEVEERLKKANSNDSSPPITHSGRSSAIGSYDEGPAPFLTNQEEDMIASGEITAGENGQPPTSGGNYYACVHCNKYFWTETSLKHHSSLYHSEKSFVCEICGKAFRFRSNLAEHRSVHTSLKPYVCKFCGKSSRLKGNLTKHILKHHKKEQNAYIGKDDIIIKKGKKSIKDPAAVDFLEKSMIVLTTSPSPVSTSTTTTTGKQLISTASSSKFPTGSSSDLASFLPPASGSKFSSRYTNKRNHAASTSSVNGVTKSKGDKTHQQSVDPIFGEGKTSGKGQMKERFPISPTISEMLATTDCFLGSDGGKLDFGGNFNIETKSQSRGTDVDAVFESLLGRSQGQQMNSTSLFDFASTMPKSTATTTLPMASSNLNQSKIGGNGGTAGTRCQLCGKHFRKTANLAVHMSIKHNQAPSSISTINDDSQAVQPRTADSTKFPILESIQPKASTPFPTTSVPANNTKGSSFSSKFTDRMAVSSALANALLQCSNSRPLTTTDSQPPVPTWDALNGMMSKSGVSKDLKEIRNVLQELKRGLPDVTKLDELLSALDARVDRLERQLETSVNTLYILVQMQTDMNSAFCQFKKDVVHSLKSLKAQHAEEEDEEEECEGLEEEEEERGLINVMESMGQRM